MDNSTAFLSNNGEYISFSFNGRTIRFKGPYSLVKFENVKEWDNGYLVVNAVYKHNPNEPVEDYIDLIPILEDLYIDPKAFLQPIKNVEVNDVNFRHGYEDHSKIHQEQLSHNVRDVVKVF